MLPKSQRPLKSTLKPGILWECRGQGDRLNAKRLSLSLSRSTSARRESVSQLVGVFLQGIFGLNP